MIRSQAPKQNTDVIRITPFFNELGNVRKS